MRKYGFAILLALALNLSAGKAQTLAPWQVGVPAATHTSCTIVTGTTQYCFASDGLWISLNGAAYVQVQIGTIAAGVSSIAVNGGTPQVGAVALAIPTKVSITSTGTLQ